MNAVCARTAQVARVKTGHFSLDLPPVSGQEAAKASARYVLIMCVAMAAQALSMAERVAASGTTSINARFMHSIH